MFLTSTWSCKNQKLSIDQFCWWITYVGCHLKDTQIFYFFNLLINNNLFKFNQWMHMTIKFKKHKKQKKIVIFFNYCCSWPISENTRQKNLNLGSNIKKKYYGLLLFHIFVIKINKVQNLNNFFFMLEVKHDNS
jgi:hypothetical protein